MSDYERFNENLRYEPETGFLYWKVGGKGKRKGKRAGNTNGHHGYKTINLDKKRYYVHRVAWLLYTKSWPSFDIDHIDHITHNNKIENLREVSKSDNQRNKTIGKNNISGTIGVSFCKISQKWRATIFVDGSHISLGYFQNAEDAKAARKTAEQIHNFHPNHGIEREV